MSTLKLNKHFGHLLAEEDFLPDTKRVLCINVTTKKGYTVKKQIMEFENILIKDITSVNHATFGKGSKKIDVVEKIKNLIRLESTRLNFIEINDIFYLFCKTYLKFWCPRCYIKQSGMTATNPHNKGFVNLLLYQSDVHYYNKLHDGIIKCFIAFLINDDRNLIYDKKTMWNDAFARILTDKIDTAKSRSHHVLANIIHNYFSSGKKNVIDEFKKIESKMTPSILNKIKLFYTHIYPVMLYFYNNRTDIFIRHGLEKNSNNYSNNMIFPPNNNDNGWRIHKVTNKDNINITPRIPAYPIEFDKVHLRDCSQHSSKEIYGNVKGFISRTDFIKNGGKIHIRYDDNDTVMARDHLFAESEISSSKWVFTFKKNSPNSLKGEINTAIASIIDATLPLINEESLILFNKILDLTLNKFIMLH